MSADMSVIGLLLEAEGYQADQIQRNACLGKPVARVVRLLSAQRDLDPGSTPLQLTHDGAQLFLAAIANLDDDSTARRSVDHERIGATAQPPGACFLRAVTRHHTFLLIDRPLRRNVGR